MRFAMVTLLLLTLLGCGGRERLGAVTAPADWRSGQVLRGTSITMPVPPRPARSYRVAQATPIVAKAIPAPEPKPVLTPAPAPKIAEPAPKPTGWVVQLGALDSPAIARSSWKAAVAQHGILQDRPLVETRAVAKGRTVYRIAAGGFASADEARRLCDTLKAEGGTCFVRS